jgi:hypothetical protein
MASSTLAHTDSEVAAELHQAATTPPVEAHYSHNLVPCHTGQEALHTGFVAVVLHMGSGWDLVVVAFHMDFD